MCVCVCVCLGARARVCVLAREESIRESCTLQKMKQSDDLAVCGDVTDQLTDASGKDVSVGNGIQMHLI